MTALSSAWALMALLMFVAAIPAAGQGSSRGKVNNNPNNGKLALDPPASSVKGQVPAEVDLPAAVTADTARLSFQVSPLSGKGLLLQQTRDALKALMAANHGGRIVNLRAFVGGTGDPRRVRQIVTEAFTEKKQPLPSLTAIQGGDFAKDGAQIVLESVSDEAAKRSLNPNGLVFLPAEAGADAASAIQRLAGIARQAGTVAADMLRVTCFLGSSQEASAAEAAAHAAFPISAVNMAPRLRAATGPAAACEGVARGKGITAAKLVFSGAQMAFGEKDADLRLAFERLQKSLEPFGVTYKDVVFAGFYPVSRAVEQKLPSLMREFFRNPASSIQVFEGLPSPDASFSMDVIAAVPGT